MPKEAKLLGLGRQYGQINFGAIWGIFGQFISAHFGTVSPLSMFSIIFKIFILDWDLNLGRKELGI